MSRTAHGASLLAALLAVAPACSRHDPPAPGGSPSIALPEPAPSAVPTSVTPLASGSTPSTSSAVSGSQAPAASGSADPSTLPQTRDRPAASGVAWDARVAGLWTAIVADDPERAMPFFFPLGAYQQVKDIGNPESDWKHRLVAAYSRDIHALHARLGADAASASLVGLEVPDGRGRWVDPGEEYNKIGYYRVFGSRLRYTVNGEARSFDVKSLISWRGEWYVVHLSAIK